MSASAKKISRLEKEAVLRSKESEYHRERAEPILTHYQDEETFENERHRRYEMMRQTRQIQREIDHQVGLIDKLNTRKQQELQKKNTSTTTRTYSSSTSSSSITDRANRPGDATEKYTSTKHNSNSKIH